MLKIFTVGDWEIVLFNLCIGCSFLRIKELLVDFCRGLGKRKLYRLLFNQ